MKHGAAWAALIMACTCGTPVSRGQNLDTEDDDVRAILQRMNARMDALERIHEDDQNKIKELEQRLKQLETIPTEEERQAQVEAIKEEIKSELAATSKSAQPPTTSAESELDALIASAGPAPAAQAETAAVMGSTQSAIQSFNPDISVNGNFLARYRSMKGTPPRASSSLANSNWVSLARSIPTRVPMSSPRSVSKTTNTKPIWRKPT